MTEKNILIIDDDQHLLLGLSARLKANGYKTSYAMDAVSAITVAVKEAPDLIILDLGLPGGDGFVVLERLKNLANLSTTPVIVLSAKNPAQNEERALAAGAVAFFQKPPDNHEFLNAIRQALGEANALATFLKT
jgi:two-component system KDP operon response regulator KdpE